MEKKKEREEESGIAQNQVRCMHSVQLTEGVHSVYYANPLSVSAVGRHQEMPRVMAKKEPKKVR